MPSQQSKKYTLGEVSIIVENIDAKLDGIKENVDKQFSGLEQSVEKLSNVLSEMVKYRAEMEGMARSTKYWVGAIVTGIMLVGGYIYKLQLDDLKSTIMTQTRLDDDKTFTKVTDWMEKNYEIRPVIIK